jgi:hypothetical protein
MQAAQAIAAAWKKIRLFFIFFPLIRFLVFS